ncbi:N-acetyl-1-D-myo-inositol-2-amino-2-deoxy-alpha-D-glucopyranoside deacetylase [Actinoalloteichus sp. GBA129-24]|uniref:1D-myo-inositol 2-acetamido-2-deoxy-alpha-D-glucopyranoside deacetylase n=1 Tax=Actinoalloteichus fjordicus TaxID=1612552 RepID=A0AAC9L872_9PSEU|nr:N-acetyl-1-D-myo-inositol-2-amino-2-deoxy-alpha-D-glucopyranoside deacetylase [Actinoalloteichus fjordicus]APU18929.1 N-acetyl-1-D-myo-inositol-2-amino-2-deoxy-alpha-D-glucopyranoside deacetylase [Actinoalloteichus sp. GBA129-24]
MVTTAPGFRLTAVPRLLLVHAHPDDESIWTGGTIAHFAARGVAVTVVTCTLGEEGEIIPAGLRGLGPEAADQLGGYRVGELRSACAALGVTDHRFLGGLGRWRDSGMRWAAPGRAEPKLSPHPRAFAIGDLDEQVAALTTILQDVRPQVVMTYAADGGYGHPDHVRAHQVTMAAARAASHDLSVFHVVSARSEIEAAVAELAQVSRVPFTLPAPGELAGVEDADISHRVDIAENLPAKLNALRAHATQVQVWQDNAGTAVYALSNGVAQPVLTRECFSHALSRPAGHVPVSIDQELLGAGIQPEIIAPPEGLAEAAARDARAAKDGSAVRAH